MTVYQIPQKTLREDKIIGPLTIRDLLVLSGFGIVGYFTFTELNSNPFVLFSGEELIFLSLLVLLTGTVWTFFKVDEKPLEVWLMYVIHFLQVPKVSLWQKDAHEESIFADNTVIVETVDDGSIVPQKTNHEIGKQFDAISKLLDAPDGVVTAKETKEVMGMLGEDDTIVAMKETIQQENKERGLVEQQSASKARLESVIGDVVSDKKQSPSAQAQVLARPEGGIRGFLQQTSRLFVSNVMDAFQVHTAGDDKTTLQNDAATVTSSQGMGAITSIASNADNTTTVPAVSEGLASSPDQLLEELRKKSAASAPGDVQQSGQPQTIVPPKTTERVKIVSDAELAD